jgi:hypothetical protein
MKKIFYLIGLLLILMTVNPFSCTVNTTTEWTVSGITIFNGAPGGGTTIKLAAFFRDGVNPNYTYLIVSNVVIATDGGDFSLDIDTSYIDPAGPDRIVLFMWKDDNDNDVLDSGENDYALKAISV